MGPHLELHQLQLVDYVKDKAGVAKYLVHPFNQMLLHHGTLLRTLQHDLDAAHVLVHMLHCLHCPKSPTCQVTQVGQHDISMYASDLKERKQHTQEQKVQGMYAHNY